MSPDLVLSSLKREVVYKRADVKKIEINNNNFNSNKKFFKLI